MKVNKELNLKYYADYMPCNCEDCQNYYEQIKEKFPNICYFLESINVDPLKPFELVFDEENDWCVYYECQYLVFGKMEQNYKKVIDGIKVTQNKYFHPSASIEEEHFVLCFGPIKLKKIKEENK